MAVMVAQMMLVVILLSLCGFVPVSAAAMETRRPGKGVGIPEAATIGNRHCKETKPKILCPLKNQ